MYKIELGESEMILIEKALDMYSRAGLGQFDYVIEGCESVQRAIWNNKDINNSDIRDICNNLKMTIWPQLVSNSNWGIFNTEEVGDDCRIACDMYQTLRHQRWLDREEKLSYTVDAYPSDICNIAGIPSPNFKIEKI